MQDKTGFMTNTMKTGTRIFKNTLSLTLGKGFGDLATLFFLVYFARIFGISIFGQYIFAMSLGGFLSILVNMGLNTLAVREISKEKNNDTKYIGNMLATQSVLAMASWSLIGVFVLLSNFDNDSRLIIIIIGAYQVLYMLAQLIQARFQAHEEMEFSAYLEIFHKVFILAFGSLFIALGKSPVITLLVYPASALCMIAIGIAVSNHKYGKPDFNVNLPFTRELLSKALPFFIMIILFQFYDRVGIVLLTFLQGDGATGIYAASDRFLVPMITGIGMFAAALFPVMSRFARDSRQDLITTYKRSARIVMIIVLPTSTFMYLLNEQIILFIYGAKFTESASVLRIISWVMLPVGLTFVCSRVLVALDQQKKIVKMQVVIYSGFLIACIVIIPRYSYTGLAYAKLVTSFVLFLAYSWYLSKTIPQSSLFSSIKSPLIACLASIIIFNLMADQSLWLSTSVSLLACIITLFLTGGIKSHDLSYIKNSF
jgi:O-antigen/teichoic acid export membrane protein